MRTARWTLTQAKMAFAAAQGRFAASAQALETTERSGRVLRERQRDLHSQVSDAIQLREVLSRDVRDADLIVKRSQKLTADVSSSSFNQARMSQRVFAAEQALEQKV